MTSVRARILIPVLVFILLGDALISWLVLRDSHHEIEEVYDAQLAQSARLLQGVLRQRDPGEADWDRLYQAFDQAMSRVGEEGVAHPYETRLTFQVWRSDGELLVRSAEAPVLATPPTALGAHDIMDNGNDWCAFLLADPQQGLLIWVGERDDIRQDLIERIVRHTLWPTLIGVPLLTVLIWLTIGWGLTPLRAMVRSIRGRNTDTLQPLNLKPLPTDLEPMQTALNRLLVQMDDLLERERRFIADAAHELRTPLAILRIHAQNAQSAATEAQRREALDFLVNGVDRATRIGSQLLTMARIEPQLSNPVRKPVQLTELVREELAELTPLAMEKGVELVLEGEEACWVQTEPVALAIALQNLVTNALNFSPAGSEVKVVIGVNCLSVEDQGPGIDEAEMERLFERFYSRDNANGAGLGLAIVEMIVGKIGSALTLHNLAQGGLRARLSFTACAQAPAGIPHR
ncbi:MULTISPECIES: ATP-binding protein [Pseudomonas]|uniref:histidine kinase n=2 Tax=Pseudomonas fluorescens TaxID=294 RepID=A0A3M3XIW5_PSEFL|nr:MULTISPECIES: ATP-binding protein [Pseudomonas]MBK5547250.1 two-component sensor histidine kinase [Pseudomonas sp. TH04]MCI4602754.1 ATP-binding protein [Pseudomonas fluorescens]NNB69314.1 two-component sensor histidine kinase [Pseudomonas fluorescens]OEC66502.1 two-component sensor histidine kinase [Pseudomonas sp. AP19]PQB01395.1 two-component sensor histidine kinase [Pseudomonas fluorescens]